VIGVDAETGLCKALSHGALCFQGGGGGGWPPPPGDRLGIRTYRRLPPWRRGSWIGIARGGDWANRWWISPDLGQFATKAQQLFDHEGKRLVHVTTYVEGNQRRWIGISRSGDWANRWYLRSDLDSFSLEAQRLFDHEHLRLVHVEMLE